MEEPTQPAVGGVLAPPSAGVRLVVEDRDQPPRLVLVPVGRSLRIGRGADQDVVLRDGNVSRGHAIVHSDGRTATVEDLGSFNGTFVDGRRVEGSAVLSTGDVIQVGGARIAVVLITSGAGGQPSAEAATMDLGTGVVAQDTASVETFRVLVRLARSRLPVLIHGETGSGKEVAAREIHRHSPRASGPFVAVNCATLTESLAESELFGHEKGAFTGASARRVGAFETAQGGTLFLDEVAELSLANQARLLRALQERAVVRLGSSTPVPVDVRIVAATNRDLALDVDERRFREDLYFRLNGATVVVPPLRSRPHDVLPIVEAILAEHGGARLGPGVATALQTYRWPGNIRELRHAIEHGLALGDGQKLSLDDLPPAVRGDIVARVPERESVRPQSSPARDGSLRDTVDDAERRAIVAVLDAQHWNQTRAARVLGISRRMLIYRMERLGLKPRAGSRLAP